jgi:hypothetical protein
MLAQITESHGWQSMALATMVIPSASTMPNRQFGLRNIERRQRKAWFNQGEQRWALFSNISRSSSYRLN